MLSVQEKVELWLYTTSVTIFISRIQCFSLQVIIIKMLKLRLIVLVYVFLNVYGKETSLCHSKQTCSECFQEYGCVWCVNSTSTMHCAPEYSNHTSRNWCDGEILRPEQLYDIITDKPLESDSNSDGGAVQIQPQHIKLKMRKGEEIAVTFQYAQARNYPIDLYYIMDLSASMEPHREKLASLGGKLTEVMRNITSNFHLGFGSFVDKVEMPFVSTVPSKLQEPCTLPGRKKVACVPPYSFKNHMSLSDNYQKFSDEVKKARVSGNLDAPEGGFDALMQAIVCQNEIGWRSGARRLVVFSTDAYFHVAGDGKLTGVVEPNDGQCHMVNDKYVADLIYDYPSISHINYIAKKNNINLIFAIVKSNNLVFKVYDLLQHHIENSRVGGLDGSSGNVVDLVLDNYNKIVDSVVITDNSISGVEIKYSSTCPSPKSNGCTNVHVGDQINFTATIRPLQCLSNQLIQIKPEGLQDSLTIDLEVTCDCPCEKPEDVNYHSNSSKCENQGDLKCGVCSCYEGRFGQNCECDSQTSNNVDLNSCKMKNESEICSGLGTCKCGKCVCDKKMPPNEISGKFCECDNFSCMRSNGLVCSGRDRGDCVCGICKCLAGWTGDACDCPALNTTCMARGSDLVCNGRGSCSCGKCQCNTEGTERYSGQYCEECPECPGQRCEELRHCVECTAYKTGIYNEGDCLLHCKHRNIEIVDTIDENPIDQNIKICRAPDKTGCTFVFEYDSNNLIGIKVLKDKICPVVVDVLMVVLWVIGSIVLVGIITLVCWKVLTSVHDQREYAKFENERAKANWERGDNPLYKAPTSVFKNPTFDG